MDYFCYECEANVDVSIMNNIFRCLDCHGEFIEELPADQPTVERRQIQNRLEVPNDLLAREMFPHTSAAMLSNRNESLQAFHNIFRARLLAASSFHIGVATADNARSRSNVQRNRRVPTETNSTRANGGLTHIFFQHGNRAGLVRNQRLVGMQGGLEDVNQLIAHLSRQNDEPVPVARQDIARIPMTRVNKKQADSSTQCATCMETFVWKETVARLDCDHIFHRECIVPWLQKCNTCPLCRRVVDPKEWTKKKRCSKEVESKA